MLFIKFLKQYLTKTYAKLTILGKLLLTLQIASMFVPIIDFTNNELNPLLLLFFFISFGIYILISLSLITEYHSFIVDNYNKSITYNGFLKITIFPFATLAAISAILFLTVNKITIIQFIFIIPIAFISYAYIKHWIDNLSKIKLPKFDIKKLFIKTNSN